MGNLTTSIENIIDRDRLAIEIANKALSWSSARSKKLEAWQEIQGYVFATDTSTTTNQTLPWRNTTTRPKLCQIRDNLHANYHAALFPTEKWFRWLPSDEASANVEKAVSIESYVHNKLRQVDFEEFTSRALLDFIDYGNAFADVEYVREASIDEDGIETVSYQGPRPVRISPLDIWFDVTAADFKRTPKIRRFRVTLGDLAKMVQNAPAAERETYQKILDRAINVREVYASYDHGESVKNKALIADGFGSLTTYYESGQVEILQFEGDLYDPENKKLLVNHRIIVVDRSWIAENRPINNWLGRSTIVHVGWRLRPDNLVAMGPLDNLVGMQYRIDHLENLKADVFDMIAFPIAKQKGSVEEWVHQPGERIFMDEEADVDFLHPDTTALNADMQIRELEDQMEEMAGAPKNAMGIRTPGEKTAFEVNKLENAASRIFQHKIAHFEKKFVEPLLNAMVEIARRNLNAGEEVRVVKDTDVGVAEFETVTKESLTAKGSLTPIGARHFATQNRLVENLTNLSASPIYQDPSVNVHISGLKIAKALEDSMSLAEWDIVEENVRIYEQMETQKTMQTAQEQILGTGMVPTEPEGDTDLQAIQGEVDATQEPPV